MYNIKIEIETVNGLDNIKTSFLMGFKKQYVSSQTSFHRMYEDKEYNTLKVLKGIEWGFDLYELKDVLDIEFGPGVDDYLNSYQVLAKIRELGKV